MKFCPYCHRIMKKVYTKWETDGILINKPVWHCCCGVLLYKLPNDVKLPKECLDGLIRFNDSYYYTYGECIRNE